MIIVIFLDYITKKEIIHKAMDHVPRKDEVVSLYYSHMPVTDYYVREVIWELEPNALPTVYVSLVTIKENERKEKYLKRMRER